MKILVTGFEPFGQDSENASGMTAERLGGFKWGPDVDVVTEILPVAACVRQIADRVADRGDR